MNIKDYHDNPAIGSSGLKELRRSPAHYWAKYRDPERVQAEPSAAFKLGTAAHCMILEPLEYEKRYTVIPEGIDKRTKEGKALFAEIEAGGMEPIKADAHADVLAIAHAADCHPGWFHLHAVGGLVEHSYFAEMQTDGGAVKVKARPDYAIKPCAAFPNGLIVDIKTAEDASQTGFAKAVWNYDYWLSASLYADVFQMIHGTPAPPDFYWLALEKEAPFACAMYSCAPELMQYGRDEYQRLLLQFAQCERAGMWPGYSQDVAPLVLPSWAQREVDGGGEDVDSIGYVQDGAK